MLPCTGAILPESIIQGILEHVHERVRHELEQNQMTMPQSPRVTIYNDA
jgi:hypothetical protein